MLALDPQSTWEYVLVSDREKPNPPRFILRYASLRAYRVCLALYRAIAEHAKAPTVAEGSRIMDEALRIVTENLVDIRDAPQPWHHADLEAVLTLAEIWELFYAFASCGRLADADRKNSPLPAPGRAGDSAESAPATPPSAGTCPDPPTPLKSPAGADTGQSTAAR